VKKRTQPNLVQKTANAFLNAKKRFPDLLNYTASNAAGTAA
jgi:hypothetical protein